jgi:hypothetical protein
VCIEGGVEIKENDGGSVLWYFVKTILNVIIYP